MIQSQPDVSIVIAAFNAAQTIDRAIISALAQQGVSLEVVVSDDRSTDTTLAVVRAIADPRIRIVALPENRGPGAARNAAIDAARGRWIAVLDADDTLLPERLARMIAKAEAADAQIAVDNLTVVTADGRSKAMFAKRDLADSQELTLSAFIRSNRLFHAQHNFGYMKPLFKRQFLSEQGLRFNESLRIGEDYILLASALAAGGRCVVDPYVGYRYHITEGSISRELRLDHVEAMIAADADFLRRYRLDAPALSAQSLRRRSLIHGHAFLTIIDCLKRRSYGQALVTALHNPAALRHFKMPVAERLRRLRRFSRQPEDSMVPQP